MINDRFGWRGYLWQGRFSSYVMDEPYLLDSARYIALNPVSAGLATHAWDYPWSSTHAHMTGKDDRLATGSPCASL